VDCEECGDGVRSPGSAGVPGSAGASPVPSPGSPGVGGSPLVFSEWGMEVELILQGS
jgi:hypothetical protein